MKSKFLEVCKGNSSKIGKMTLIISFKSVTIKKNKKTKLAQNKACAKQKRRSGIS